MIKCIFFILWLCFSVNMVSAKYLLVSSASEINMRKWTSGDTIVMKNGNWIDQTIVFRGVGMKFHPVVLLAQTPGKVILKGNSSLSFSGSFLEISGLFFYNGTLKEKDIISFRTSTTSIAENCSLYNTAIVSCNPSEKTVDNKWVSMYGKDNIVANCTFANKTNSGTLFVVWLDKDVIPNHTIENNYFGYRNPNKDNSGKELNGQEIIRIGDSHTSMQTAGVTVKGNFFEDCNGETEIISNKSCGNNYSNNIFVACKGTLTLRHGNNCTVDGNYFIGNNVPGTGGVRIIGENHKVYNNYFENLNGTDFRAAICLVRGKENSEAYEYFQVKNALVAFNTMVNCSQSFSINYNNSTFKMPPIGSVIAFNHVYNTSSTKMNVKIDQTSVADMDVKWKINLMNQGKYENFRFSKTQVITGIESNMIQVGTSVKVYEPDTGTGLTGYTSSEFPEITYDIRGRVRASQKLPGASQASGETNLDVPDKDSVGATFIEI